MKEIILFLVIIAFSYGCTKDDNQFSRFSAGTYSGEKTIYYMDTHNKSVDTISIRFDSSTYIYSGSWALDNGHGNYFIKDNLIEFNDDVARIALYSWEWILGGTHNFRIVGDSLILNQTGSYIKVTSRLVRVSE
jgi:hypothetical protein